MPAPPVPPEPEPEDPLPPECDVPPPAPRPAPPLAPVVPPEVPPLVPLVAPEVPPLVPEEVGAELELGDAAADAEPADPAELLVVLVVEVVDFLEVVVWFEAAVAVGTVSGGAPAVLVAGEPPPHAARLKQAPTPASAFPRLTVMDTARRRGTTGDSDFKRLHAPGAMRAVVEILLTQLVTPVAETQVLDRPRQLGRRGGERQELRDHLKRFPGLAVDVRTAGLGLDHDLPPGGWRPHPVPLTQPHSEPSYSSLRRGAASRSARAGVAARRSAWPRSRGRAWPPGAERGARLGLGAADGPRRRPPAERLDRVPPVDV